MTINPDYGYRSDRLTVAVGGLRHDLGPRPKVYFSLPLPGSGPGPAEVTVTSGSVRQTGAGAYEFELSISIAARPRAYTVVLTRQPGWSDTAGTFNVRDGIRLANPPSRRGLTLALQQPAVTQPTTLPQAMPSTQNAPVIERILNAEAEILSIMAQAAALNVHCPKWVRAAAKKERAAAKVIKAAAALSGALGCRE